MSIARILTHALALFQLIVWYFRGNYTFVRPKLTDHHYGLAPAGTCDVCDRMAEHANMHQAIKQLAEQMLLNFACLSSLTLRSNTCYFVQAPRKVEKQIDLRKEQLDYTPGPGVG